MCFLETKEESKMQKCPKHTSFQKHLKNVEFVAVHTFCVDCQTDLFWHKTSITFIAVLPVLYYTRLSFFHCDLASTCLLFDGLVSLSFCLVFLSYVGGVTPENDLSPSVHFRKVE